MSKIKKLFAVILSLAMIMGLNLTSFAATDSATITVANAGADATFKTVQLIAADTEAETGWVFTSEAIANAYKAAFKMTDDQAVIKALIAANTAGDTNTNIAAALNAVKALNLTADLTSTSSPITVSAAGLYYIEGSEENYVYNPMAAYIAFGSYDTTTGAPTTLENTTVEAKKEPTWITKGDNTDKVVEVGSTVTYSLTSSVPFLPLTDTNRTYKIEDKITGAAYAVEAEGTENAGKLAVSVKIGTGTATTYYVDVANNGFTIDLSGILEGNAYANQDLLVEYSAVVTSYIVGNDVYAGDGTHDGKDRYGSDHDDVYTGTLTIHKTGDDQVALAGAEFVIYKTLADNAVVYATFDAVKDNELTGWVTAIEDATHVTTDAQGNVSVKGLDDSTTYSFKEVVAPAGYTVSQTDAVATWSNESPVTNKVGNASMSDTRMSALPATGGIGTTIFTIGGCVIMILAAGLFFASRKKSSNK